MNDHVQAEEIEEAVHAVLAGFRIDKDGLGRQATEALYEMGKGAWLTAMLWTAGNIGEWIGVRDNMFATLHPLTAEIPDRATQLAMQVMTAGLNGDLLMCRDLLAAHVEQNTAAADQLVFEAGLELWKATALLLDMRGVPSTRE